MSRRNHPKMILHTTTALFCLIVNLPKSVTAGSRVPIVVAGSESSLCYDPYPNQIPCPPSNNKIVAIVCAAILGTAIVATAAFYGIRHYKRKRQEKKASSLRYNDAYVTVPDLTNTWKYKPRDSSSTLEAGLPPPSDYEEESQPLYRGSMEGHAYEASDPHSMPLPQPTAYGRQNDPAGQESASQRTSYNPPVGPPPSLRITT